MVATDLSEQPAVVIPFGNGQVGYFVVVAVKVDFVAVERIFVIVDRLEFYAAHVNVGSQYVVEKRTVRFFIYKVTQCHKVFFGRNQIRGVVSSIAAA